MLINKQETQKGFIDLLKKTLERDSRDELDKIQKQQNQDRNDAEKIVDARNHNNNDAVAKDLERRGMSGKDIEQELRKETEKQNREREAKIHEKIEKIRDARERELNRTR